MAQKRKQMLMTSLIMLIVACIALTSTTFAWFSGSEYGYVDDFEFTVEDASGIQLSVDAENWKSTILSNDIQNQVNTDTGHSGKAQTGSRFITQVTEFSPVSTHPDTAKTTNDTEKGRLTMFTTSASSSSSGKEQLTATATNNGFYVFNIYVNNLSENSQSLDLTNFNVFGVSGVDKQDKNAQLASRIAFIDEGSISKASGTAAQVKAAALATNEAVTIKILEPNSETHTGFATTYYGATSTYKNTNGVAKAGTYNLTNGFIGETGDDVKAVFGDELFLAASETVAILDANSITKLTIYVWIEGQDIDCSNDIASSTVGVKMTFKASENTAEYKVSYNANTTDATVANIPSDGTNYRAKSNVTVKFETSGGAVKRTNYTFLGWASSSDAVDPEFTSGGIAGFKIVRNTTLYAVWAGASTVRYDVTGGTDSNGWETPSDATVAYNASVTVTAPAANKLLKTGKIFKGWSTSASGPVEVPAGTSKSFSVKKALTLYAVWADAVTVSYNANTNETVTGLPASASVEKGSTYTLANLTGSAIPQRTGYTFKGWTTVSGGTDVQFLANGSAAFTVNESTSLYAVWEAN